MTNFSEQIRELRTKLNISQEELASRLNVSFATVNRWEGGKAQPQKAQLDAFNSLFDEAGMTHEDTSSRRKRGVHKSEVLSTRSMEQMLWDAACSIRGEKDAAKYKDYILPLLFIKRLSDVFDDEIQRLAETYGDADTALSILEADHSLVRFYIPREARWNVVSGRESFDWSAERRPKSLGEQMTTTIRAIVKHNPSLAGVIDIVDYNETRNGEREISDSALRGIIETFSDPRYRLGLHNVEPDFLGRCYEYLLRKFAEGQGQSGGEFFTPTEVGLLMAEIMRPRSGEECYDYACGSFGLLIKLQLICRRLDPLSKLPLRLYGQEREGSSFAIACMNKIIHDMEGEIVRGDSMRNPKFKDNENRLKKFDIVVANPMWNQPFDQDVYENDPFNRFEQQGGITTSKADWAWLQHTLSTLKETGRAAVVLDTGAVTRGSGSKNEDKERNIRKWFVEHDLIDGVILMPDNLFYNTSAAGVIVVLRKNKPKDRKGKIILVNASQEFKKGAPKNYLTKEGIEKIAAAFVKGEVVDRFVTVITNEEAAKSDFNLLPSGHLKSSSDETFCDLNEMRNKLAKLDLDEQKTEKQILLSLKGKESPQHQELLNSTLPKDWEWHVLSEYYRTTKKPRTLSYAQQNDIPFVPMEAVPVNGKDIVRYENRDPSKIASGTYFEKGDVLLSKITPSFENGKQGMANSIPKNFGVASTEIIPLQAIDENANNFYLFYYLLHPEIRAYLKGKMEGSTGRQRVPESAVRNLQIPIPPKKNQAKIAALLKLIQKAVDIQEQKRCLFQDLFKATTHLLMSGQLDVSNIDIDTSEIT